VGWNPPKHSLPKIHQITYRVHLEGLPSRISNVINNPSWIQKKKFRKTGKNYFLYVYALVNAQKSTEGSFPSKNPPKRRQQSASLVIPGRKGDTRLTFFFPRSGRSAIYARCSSKTWKVGLRSTCSPNTIGGVKVRPIRQHSASLKGILGRKGVAS